VLNVRHLRAGYDGGDVVHDLDLEVAEGEVVALLGANGAGKSTALRAICGLLAPSRGHVEVDGTDVTGWPADRLARHGVACVPTERHLFPRLRVRDNLALGAYPERLDSGRLDAVLELFPRLGERLRQPAGTLSGGEQQMLALGRALVRGPRLLVLDEPSTGLAPVLVDELFGALASLVREGGVTLLLAEQQVASALALADRGYVLEDGWLRLQGTAAALREDPRIRDAYLGVR
jgi:branched-chain amino acid transport system ATP-binding protein